MKNILKSWLYLYLLCCWLEYLPSFDSAAIGFEISIAVEENLRMASFLGENAAQCEAKEPPENASGENVFIFLNIEQNNFNSSKWKYLYLPQHPAKHFKASTRTSTLRSPVGFGSAPVGNIDEAQNLPSKKIQFIKQMNMQWAKKYGHNVYSQAHTLIIIFPPSGKSAAVQRHTLPRRWYYKNIQ